MPRGNPNFKPKYGGETTKVVRLPETLADKLLEMLGGGIQVSDIMQRVSELPASRSRSAQAKPAAKDLEEWNCYAVNSQTGEEMLVVGDGHSETEIKDTAHKMFTSWDSDPYPGCRIEYRSEAIGSAASSRVKDANRRLTQALERNAKLSRQLFEIEKERNELDKEVNELHAKNGDLGLELQQARAEAEELRSLIKAGELPSASLTLPEPADLLNQLKGKLKGKTKVTLRDVEALLEMLS